MNKNKKEYLPTELTIIEFDKGDVIATSGLPFVDPDDNSWV